VQHRVPLSDDAESKGDLLRAASDAVHAAKQVAHVGALRRSRTAGVGDAAGVQLGRRAEAGHLTVHYRRRFGLLTARDGVEASCDGLTERGLMSTVD
jgi:hypothetical protein